ncbi:hypothetical protein DGG96_08390 [Legionella qingyii]|uniref:Uncharacterized protein n=2 Tax=Legionella qingyii TaxID=2184757 RepID=A0A317U362_9GAMM|nr:hypothetical protein DGG96_08390 [Legionella qingyii]
MLVIQNDVASRMTVFQIYARKKGLKMRKTNDGGKGSVLIRKPRIIMSFKSLPKENEVGIIVKRNLTEWLNGMQISGDVEKS